MKKKFAILIMAMMMLVGMMGQSSKRKRYRHIA